MALDIWSRDDIRNVILAANAAGAGQMEQTAAVAGEEGTDAFQAGYQAALETLARAFDIPMNSDGRLHTPGVVIPGGRLAVSYRAERALQRLLQQREEWWS